MLAFYCDGSEVKKFMSLVIGGSAFDRFQLRSGEIVTRVKFTIDGRASAEDGSEAQRAYCLWGDVRQNVYDLIKGKRLPACIRLVFALDDEALPRLHPNARAAFLNMVFENGRITFTTGTAQNSFSLDKSLDEVWESSIKKLFVQLGIAVEIMT